MFHLRHGDRKLCSTSRSGSRIYAATMKPTYRTLAGHAACCCDIAIARSNIARRCSGRSLMARRVSGCELFLRAVCLLLGRFNSRLVSPTERVILTFRDKLIEINGMAIEVKQINDKQLRDVPSYLEGHFLDVKSKDIKPAKLTKTISAFANADGGEIYIGIAENVSLPFPHKWQGFANPEEANGHLQAFESLFPLGEDYLYNFLSHPNQKGVILQVIVRKTRAVVRASDGLPYIRRGAQNLRVDTAAKLAILERNKGITSFENEPVSVELANVCNSEIVIKFILDVVPTSEPEDWLRKQELIKGDKPTVAGVVLFSDLPQALLPKRTGIKVYRYKSSDEEGSRDTLVGDPVSIGDFDNPVWPTLIISFGPPPSPKFRF